MASKLPAPQQNSDADDSLYMSPTGARGGGGGGGGWAQGGAALSLPLLSGGAPLPTLTPERLRQVRDSLPGCARHSGEHP
jgi:hypothetical protein